MSDPHRPEVPSAGYPPYADPAYAGQLPGYGGYPPSPAAPAPPGPPPGSYWSPGPPPGPPPRGGGDGAGGGSPGPQGPRRPPGWLFALATVAVLVLVALVAALMIITSGEKSDRAAQKPTIPSMTTAPPRVPASPTRPPHRIPSLPPAPIPVPPPTEPSTSPAPGGTAQTIVYRVTGAGRAVSIAYLDTGGVWRTELDVQLPWSKEVSLTPPASTAASVTVISLGQQVSCSLSIDGAQMRQQTGMVLAICTAIR